MSLTPENLSQRPITIPGSPFWNVLRRFGRDEVIAMGINVLGTAVTGFFSASAALLSVIGPIVEKIGFFPAHFVEAWKIHRTTPEAQRQSLGHYIKRAVRGGAVSLAEDVLVHDPVYIVLMYLGLSAYKGTPAWILSAVSFVIAVIAVAFIEVGITEARYLIFKWRAKRAGFEVEKYYESRFLVDAVFDPDQAMKLISEQFDLDTAYEMVYNDTYFDNTLPEYSDRTAKFRLRKRTDETGAFVRSAQIVYTRAAEVCEDKFEQARFFPIKKEKIYFELDSIPSVPVEMDPEAGAFADKYVDGDKAQSLAFSRMVSYNKVLLVSADRIRGSRDFYLLEVKVYKDIEALVKAMRFVMRELPVLQTTHGKLELTT